MIIPSDDKPYLVDRAISKRLKKLNWCLDKGRNKPRAKFHGKTMFLHKVVCVINGVEWKDVKFLNEDDHDCRFANLAPFDISKDRKSRVRKDSSTGLTGVTWVQRIKKYSANISVRGRRKFLGNFGTLSEAGSAYARAWNDAHPDKTQIRVAGRGRKVFYVDEKADG